MICTITEFCNYVRNDLNGVLDTLAEEVTRPFSDSERMNLSESYTAVSKMFSASLKRHPNLGDVHISTTNMLMEYKLPAAASWCDMVLLGDGKQNKQVFIIELKNWMPNNTDKAGEAEGLIGHQGERLHPSDQVKGYVEYCRCFHSAVLETKAEVNGCVFFSQNIDVTPYTCAPNDRLTADYPVYNTDMTETLSDYIADKIIAGDEEFATKFVNGHYQQNRDIMKQVAKNLSTSDARPFVLLEKQRLGYNEVMNVLENLKEGEKKVIIVTGPPGSGKSAIAINLWIDAVQKFSQKDLFDIDTSQTGNIVFVSTSASQTDNWKRVFDVYGQRYGAGGAVLKSNEYKIPLNSSNCRYYHDIFYEIDHRYSRDYANQSINPEYFREYINYFLENEPEKMSGYIDNLHFLSIVDEAHALVNPLAPGFKTQSRSLWPDMRGPQVYHIIRLSQVSVFFTDSKQSFRDNETTSIEDIEKYANELGADIVHVSLDGMQFRCDGSKDYVDWVEGLFSDKPIMNHYKWKNLFDLDICDYPSEVDDFLRKQIDKGKTVRLLSTYSKKWVSYTHISPDHHEENVDFDFILEDKNGQSYNKYWNTNNEAFVQAVPGSKMSVDQLCEVGCAYVVRGFDYDYVGILWLNDVVRRGNHWELRLQNILGKETGCAQSAAKEEVLQQYSHLRKKDRPDKNSLNETVVDLNNEESAVTKLFVRVAQAYRILMTRAFKGIRLYIEDKETRDYVKSLL